MGEKQITKNFKLTGEFNNYAVNHPEVFEGIPGNACIIMIQKNDPEFTKENLELAKKIIRKEGKKCYKAFKKNHKWILEAI